MSDRSDLPPAMLGEVLTHALDRAFGTSLESLHSLRQAVRNYTGSQIAKGIPLDSVMLALSQVLMEAEDQRLNGAETQGLRDPELARQLRAWCGEDYAKGFKGPRAAS